MVTKAVLCKFFVINPILISAANPTRIDSSDVSAEMEEDRQIFIGIAGINAALAALGLSKELCIDNNCKWSVCPKRWCTGKFVN